MRILSVDPGTTNVAVAIVDRDAKGWHLLWSPILHGLDEYLSWLATAPDIECVVCESVSWQFSRHAKQTGVEHGHRSADMLRAVGAAQLLAKMRRVPFLEVLPHVWRKRVAGSGKVSKEQVREWVKRAVRGVPDGIGLNRSDAIAIGIAGASEPGVARSGMEHVSGPIGRVMQGLARQRGTK